MLKQTVELGPARSTRRPRSSTRGERGARPEERRAGERADALTEIEPVVDLERERLPHADERDDGDQPDHVRARAEDDPRTPAADAARGDEADEHAEAASDWRERGAWPRACAGALRSSVREHSARRERLHVSASARRAGRAAAAVGGDSERLELRRGRGCGPGASRGRRRGRPGG
jgi:hypothetical protein